MPITLRGGIRAQSGRGLHGRPWWSRRWLDVIEGFRLGARLGRGRSYALSGQVARLDIEPGHVTATVQGAHAQPYCAEIRLRCLDEAGRAHLLEVIRKRPMLAARLLVRDLPREMEALFLDASCPLFPARSDDITTSCSCPDWANPCKHLAAVYFLLGEALDRDPFLLLTLRGIRREDLVEWGTDGGRRSDAGPPPAPIPDAPAANPLQPADGRAFWGAELPPFDDYGPDAKKNPVAAPLVRRLGPLPFWRGQERFLDAMDAVYARAAPLGWNVWTGEPVRFRRVEPPPPSDREAGRLHRLRLQMDIL